MPSSRWHTRHEPPPRPSTGPRTPPPVTRLRAESRPKAVTASVWVWRGATLVALAITAATLTQFDLMHAALLAAAAQHSPTAGQSDLDRAANLSILVLITTGVLIALLQFGFAAALRAGRSWARPMLVAVAGLSAAYGLILLGGMDSTTLGSIAVAVKGGLLLHSALGITATVLMFLPAARPWLRRRTLVAGRLRNPDLAS